MELIQESQQQGINQFFTVFLVLRREFILQQIIVPAKGTNLILCQRQNRILFQEQADIPTVIINDCQLSYVFRRQTDTTAFEVHTDHTAFQNNIRMADKNIINLNLMKLIINKQ